MALVGYREALRGFTAPAIAAGISRFLRGECDGVSTKFCPYPPELARIVRTTVIPSLVPPERRVEHRQHEEQPGARERMRLKMPMLQAAWGSPERMSALDKANREGFGAMVVLAAAWGVAVPQELLDAPEHEAEADWKKARIAAQREVERNPPPYMRTKRYRDSVGA